MSKRIRAQDLMARAATRLESKIGYTEGKRNWNIFAAEVKGAPQNAPYCATAVVWAYLGVGVDLRKVIPLPYFVPSYVDIADARGWRKRDGQRRGDLALYDWQDDWNDGDHIGMSTPRPGTGYWAAEANTSPTSAGSQGNGGGVYRRRRSSSDLIGWLDMETLIEETHPHLLTGHAPTEKPAPVPPRSDGKLEVDGKYGPLTHSEVQRRRGRPVDGRLGAGDLADLCEFLDLPRYDEISDQYRTAAQIGSGIVPAIWDHDPDHTGPRSRIVRRTEAYAGATVDRGSWGPELSSTIQTMLNAHPGFMTPADAGIVAQRIAKAGQ